MIALGPRLAGMSEVCSVLPNNTANRLGWLAGNTGVLGFGAARPQIEANTGVLPCLLIVV